MIKIERVALIWLHIGRRIADLAMTWRPFIVQLYSSPFTWNSWRVPKNALLALFVCTSFGPRCVPRGSPYAAMRWELVAALFLSTGSYFLVSFTEKNCIPPFHSHHSSLVSTDRVFTLLAHSLSRTCSL